MFDLVESFHLVHALAALERAGILKSLEKPVDVGKLATNHSVDRAVLRAALRMLAVRTNLIAERAGKYNLTRRYDAMAHMLLLQYVGAYGKHAVEFERILRDPSSAGKLVDRERYAKAFDHTEGVSINVLADLVLQLGLNHVLDLGCATGTMLLSVAARSRKFSGWGLDLNPYMCTTARRKISAARATRRITIFEGDCRDLKLAIPIHVAAMVCTITAASVANEFFRNGTTDVIDWLASLKSIFPGRSVLIADYYGQLGNSMKPRSRQVALHDFVQVITGQGVPPANLKAWKRIYRAARCDFVHAFEVRNSSFFIHILRL